MSTGRPYPDQTRTEHGDVMPRAMRRVVPTLVRRVKDQWAEQRVSAAPARPSVPPFASVAECLRGFGAVIRRSNRFS